ncbi:MAG: site-2 protease family protein [Chloroflexi bacterium]|nr:site-2 protease family protein [Chloroflexota bacterium]
MSFDPIDFAIGLVAILLAITVHEFSHALAATALGDHTARRLGRLSLNPLVHLDPMGTIMLILTRITGFGIGWGKPVPINPANLRGNRRYGMAIVGVAGPASNLLLAALFLLMVRPDGPFRIAWHPSMYGQLLGMPSIVADFIGISVIMNVGLAIFNMIPLVPLDGSRLLVALLPGPLADRVERLERYGPGLLIGVLFADQFLRLGILSSILSPVFRFVLVNLVQIVGGRQFVL